jgi:hypothetical protein
VTGEDSAPRREALVLECLDDPGLRLAQPMRLIAEYEPDAVIVVWDETRDFGVGPTLEAAVADFRRSIAAIYHRIEAAAGGGPRVAAVRHVLARYIERRGAVPPEEPGRPVE